MSGTYSADVSFYPTGTCWNLVSEVILGKAYSGYHFIKVREQTTIPDQYITHSATFYPLEPFTTALTTFLWTFLLFVPLSCFLSQTAVFSAASPLHRDGRACGRPLLKAPSHPASTLSAALSGLHCTSVDAVSVLWLHVTMTYSKSWWCPCCDEWVSISPPSPLSKPPLLLASQPTADIWPQPKMAASTRGTTGTA